MKIQPSYQASINRVFQYIDEHLANDLSLTAIAEIALFSPFHFHRIFKFITGETLNKYVNRKRIEQSVDDLLHRDMAIAEIALKNGFQDHSSFTRAFKLFYGLSPSAFKEDNLHRFSKIRQIESKNGQTYPSTETYLRIIDQLKNWIKMNANIEVKNTNSIPLAYVTSIGQQNIGQAFQTLLKWARPKGLVNEQTRMITLYHDSFKVTEAAKVRMSAGIALAKPIESDNIVEVITIPAGKHLVAHFEIGLDEFEKSWTGVYLWMNENGYQKADRNPFEIYHNNFEEHPEKKSMVDFYIPIR